MALTIDKNLCPKLKICPVEAITQECYGLPKIDPEKCIECGKCIKFCGMGAVHKKQDNGKTV